MHRAEVATIALILAGATVSCGGLTTPRSDATQVPAPEGTPIRWDRPAHTIEVDSVETALSLLGFVPIVPQLVPPPSVYVSAPDEIPQDSRGLFFVYAEEEGTPFWIIETRAEIQQQDLENAVRDCEAAVSCVGEHAIVPIRGGIRALLIDGGTEATSVTWLENGLQLRVQGPAATFTADEALAAAEQV